MCRSGRTSRADSREAIALRAARRGSSGVGVLSRARVSKCCFLRGPLRCGLLASQGRQQCGSACSTSSTSRSCLVPGWIFSGGDQTGPQASLRSGRFPSVNFEVLLIVELAWAELETVCGPITILGGPWKSIGCSPVRFDLFSNTIEICIRIVILPRAAGLLGGSNRRASPASGTRTRSPAASSRPRPPVRAVLVRRQSARAGRVRT